MYTKIINVNALGYRNHFPFNAGFAFVTTESQMSFRICGASKKHDVIFSSDKIENVAEMKKIINQFYDPRRSSDSAFVDGSELMICEDQDMATDDEDWSIAEGDAYDGEFVKSFSQALLITLSFVARISSNKFCSILS